jgi:NAD(P)-dependent dehydrogenase (short-subunit alcohol dehydrogenase family)
MGALRAAVWVAVFATFATYLSPLFDEVTFDPSSLAGQRVIVTGASQGIGSDIARYLVQHGARVVIAARDVDKLRAVRDSFQADHHHHQPLLYPADLSEAEQCEHLIEFAVDALGGLDMLFLNHAVQHHVGVVNGHWKQKFNNDDPSGIGLVAMQENVNTNGFSLLVGLGLRLVDLRLVGLYSV